MSFDKDDFQEQSGSLGPETERGSADDEENRMGGSSGDFVPAGEEEKPELENIPEHGEDSASPIPLSFLEIIYGVMAQPRDTFTYLSGARPLLKALFFVLLATLFDVMVGLGDLDSLETGMGLPVNLSAFLAPLVFVGLIGAFIVWFLNTAAVGLVSQLFGGAGNGTGLFCAFSFGMLPTLITAIAGFGIRLAGLGTFISGAVGFGGFIWAMVLNIMALKEVEQLPTGKAILVYFAVPLSIIVSVLLFMAFTVALLAPWINQLQSVPLK